MQKHQYRLIHCQQCSSAVFLWEHAFASDLAPGCRLRRLLLRALKSVKFSFLFFPSDLAVQLIIKRQWWSEIYCPATMTDALELA